MTKDEKAFYLKQYQLLNKERIAQQRRDYREANRDKINEIQNERYRNLSNDDKQNIILRSKEYYQNNKEEIKSKSQLWRQRTRKTYGLKNPGSYNITNAERNIEKWNTEILIVYKFKMIDEDGTIFYKIGLTNNLKNRQRQLPYTVELLNSIILNKYDAVYLEYFLLKNVKKYIPLKTFKGYTECYI